MEDVMAPFLRHELDGVVIMGEVATRSLCHFMHTREIPTVVVDNKESSPASIGVCIDNLGGGRAAAEHLIQQGYPRVAIIRGRQLLANFPRSD